MTVIWEQIQEEFECQHARQEIRYTVQSNGVYMYRKQCLRCGEATTSALRHSSIANINAIGEFDQELRQRWIDMRTQRYRELANQGNEQWWIQYEEYLNSTRWQQKRLAVLQRDDYQCQACLHRKATQAHHLTYQHVCDEPLFELVAVCDVCHEKLHKRHNGNNGSAR